MGTAWITAWSAVTVAIIGVVGNLLARSRPRPGDDDPDELANDLNVIRALSSLLEQCERRNRNLERRLAACEAREKAGE